MKISSHLATIFLAGFLLLSTGVAAEDPVPDTVILNKFPTLSGDELKQIPFKASIPENYNPIGVSWELHNPFRDKAIAGIVLTIEYKTPSADTPTVLEVYIRAECGPLQSISGHDGFFNAEQAIKLSPIIKLKEVHYSPWNP